MTSPIIVRFAPSPTGDLHLGNARTALVNWLFARRQAGGRLILRFDDTDSERSHPELEAGIAADLRWLGLDWDEEHRQSERGPVYAAAFAALREAGAVYPCYETGAELAARREAQAARGLPPRYDRAALRLSATERAALEAAGRQPYWRFRLPEGAVRFADAVRGAVDVPLAPLSDPVVRREDGSPTYLFASVADDLDLGVTHVIRGEDHLTNTGPQLALARALGAAREPTFAHLPLLQDLGGGKLSKRAGSASLRELREAGIEPLAVAETLARLGTGRAPAGITALSDLIADFDLAAFAASPPRLDPAALDRVTVAVLHHMPFAAAAPRLTALGLAGADARFWEAVRPNLARLAEARLWWTICREPLAPVIEDPDLLAAAADLLPDALLDAEAAAAWLKRMAEATGRHGRALYHPLRLALTAREHGPELRHLLPLIGRDRAARRLRGETA